MKFDKAFFDNFYYWCIVSCLFVLTLFVVLLIEYYSICNLPCESCSFGIYSFCLIFEVMFFSAWLGFILSNFRIGGK